MKSRTVFLASLFAVICVACRHTMPYNNGIYEGRTIHAKPSGYGCWVSNNHITVYEGFWSNGKWHGNGTLTVGDTVYYGSFSNNKYHGYGVLTYRDSTLYAGLWNNGKRQGEGICYNKYGDRVIGLWDYDTIVKGTVYDSLGIYTGELNTLLQPSGHGMHTSYKGLLYEGQWQEGLREGFGYAIGSEKRFRVGEWKQDKYLGERIIHTVERIYGIDISKYQHVIGRKKYAINWDKIRITHLGTISKKRVKGIVDYPVSFVYIKSTEGKTVKNPYYTTDYRDAKKHGYKVGAYHFFSTTSSAKMQAYYFLNNTKFSRGDFPPVLDVEPSHNQIEKMGGAEAMFNSIRTWMSIVEKHVGVRPILYISQSFVNKYLPLAPDIKQNYLIWIARYGEYKPDVQLVYWQLSPDGRVNGIHGDVDINVFNGYKGQFNEFIASHLIK